MLECFPFNIVTSRKKKNASNLLKTQPIIVCCPVKCSLLLSSLAENMASWCIFLYTIPLFRHFLVGGGSHWNLFISKRVEFGASWWLCDGVFYQFWNVSLPQTDRELDSFFMHCQGFSIRVHKIVFIIEMRIA